MHTLIIRVNGKAVPHSPLIRQKRKFWPSPDKMEIVTQGIVYLVNPPRPGDQLSCDRQTIPKGIDQIWVRWIGTGEQKGVQDDGVFNVKIYPVGY